MYSRGAAPPQRRAGDAIANVLPGCWQRKGTVEESGPVGMTMSSKFKRFPRAVVQVSTSTGTSYVHSTYRNTYVL